MKEIVLSPEAAKRIVLHAGGLSRPAAFGQGTDAVFKAIDQLGYVQLDTNSTVVRAHHHILFTRVPGYRTAWLQELQDDGRIFEYLTSDSGYIPMQDYRFSLPIKQAFMQKRQHLPHAETTAIHRVLDRITREGPLMLKDFENDRPQASTGWWDWRPAKIALEQLYHDGRLMVTRNKDFHKQYDLPVNLLPTDTDTSMPSPVEFARHIIFRNLRALGIAAAKELSWRARFVKNNLVKKELDKLVEEGLLYRARIENHTTATLYLLPAYHRKQIKLTEQARVLSPFDPLNVFRHRLRDFFDFDYQIECFVPAPKRIYGYFSLPVLVGDRFVARMDTKADRKTKTLIIHNLHFEKTALTGIDLQRTAEAIQNFATFNQCDTIDITRSNHRQYTAALKTAIGK